MLIVIGPEWRHLFNDPAFRLGWTDARLKIKPRAEYETEIFYTHGRQMALEVPDMALPAASERLTPAMHAVIKACTSFVDMMITSEDTKAQAAKERAELIERLELARSEMTARRELALRLRRAQ